MEPVRLRLVFPRRRRILSKSEEELNRSWFLLNPTIYPTIADVSSHISHIFNLDHSCPHGISLSMDGFVIPPYEPSCILKDKELIRVRRKKGRTSREIVDEDEVKLIKGDDYVEKNTVCTDLLLLTNGEFDTEPGIYQNELEEGEVNLVEDQLEDQSKKRKKSKKLRNAKIKRKGKTSVETGDVADGIELTGKEETMEKQHEEFEKETNIYQSEIQEKIDHLIKGSLLADNSDGKETVPKKRKASEEPESPKKKKKQAGWLYRFFESDGEAEQNQPCQSINSDVPKNESNQCNGLSSEMNVDDMEKKSELESRQVREIVPTNALRNDEIVEPLPTPTPTPNTESLGVPHKSEETKKISKSARRQYERRKMLKELKAEAKELLAENVLIRSSIRNIATRSVKPQQHNQSGVVVKPTHIRFEPYEKEEDAQKSGAVVETCQSIGTDNKKKNYKLGDQKYVYCTRSNCKKSGEEVLQVVTIEKEDSPSNMDFNKFPLLSTCPKEGDVIAYRVLEQSPEIGPILSSFRVGKTLRLDSLAKMLILTPVEENPVTSKESDIGALKQQQNISDIGGWEQRKDISDTNAGEQQNKPDTSGWEQRKKSDISGCEQQLNKSDADKSGMNAGEQQNKSDTGGWERQKKSDISGCEQQQNKSDADKSGMNAGEQQNKPDTSGWEQQKKSHISGCEQQLNKSDADKSGMNAGEQQNKSDTGGWEQQNKSDISGCEQQLNKSNADKSRVNAWEQQNKSDRGGWEQQQNKSDTSGWGLQKNQSDTNAWEQQQNKSNTSGWEQQQNKSNTTGWEQLSKMDTAAWEWPKNKSVTNAWGQQQNISNTGGWEQWKNKSYVGGGEQQNNSIHEEKGHIEIDIAALYDVRIVKHTSLPEKEVDIWDSLSQTASLKTSLLTSKREWGKVGPTTASGKQQWAKMGPDATSTKQDWARPGPTKTWPKKDWAKADPTTTSSKKEWGKVGPNKSFSKAKKGWGINGPTVSSMSNKPFNIEKKNGHKVGPTSDTWKKEGSNVGPNMSSWSSKPFGNEKKEWGSSVNPSTNSWKKEGSNVGPSTSSWSTKSFGNEKQAENENGHEKINKNKKRKNEEHDVFV